MPASNPDVSIGTKESHSTLKEDPDPCPVAEKITKAPQTIELSNHHIMDIDEEACLIDGSLTPFSGKVTLDGNFFNHSPKKPFVCNLCQKAHIQKKKKK